MVLFQERLILTMAEPYYIKRIDPEDKPLVLRFLREIFYEDEPLNSHLYRIQNENLRYFDRGMYATSFVDDGLSVMAITPSGQIIAIALNESVRYGREKLIHTSKKLETNPIYPKVKRIVVKAEDHIDQVMGLPNKNKKIMNLKIIGIHPKWRNKGLGKEMLKKTRDVAELNGFCEIRSACTSAFSAKMFENFGFECVYTLHYKNHKEDGKVVFKPPEPHTAIRGLVYKL